jgi:hypothetical protein
MRRMPGYAKSLAAGVALVAAPCAGQPAAPADSAAPGESTIVVTGQAPHPAPPADVYDQALKVTRLDPRQAYVQALPRFETPLCPGVFGLREDYAEQIVERVRANAAMLKIPVAKAGCSINLLVAFLDDGRSFLDGLAHKQPQMFRLVDQSERSELLEQPAPVRVWSNIAKRWTGAGPAPAGWPKLRPSVWGQLSRTSLPEANTIQSALVVFDRDAAVGMTLTQLADYATMRGLSHTRPIDNGQPMSTILALFAGDTREPEALTSFDRSYLQSLYFEAANQPAQSKLLAVRRRARRGG